MRCCCVTWARLLCWLDLDVVVNLRGEVNKLVNEADEYKVGYQQFTGNDWHQP